MDNSRNPSTISPPPRALSTRGAEDDWTGQTLGEFHILRRLGRGGMGQVFLAEQKSLKRKVALKILRPELSANATALARFQIEAESVASLTHANIVQVYGRGEQDGVHYMALEYVEGRNLRDYLNRKGPPDLTVTISIMRQIAAALQRAAEQGIVHRDIKPENILLTRKGEVKVADFGLTSVFGESRKPLNLTQSGVAMGTPLYMSPEQVQGKTVDPRSDIYSFGVTCFHMLTGQTPFRGTNAFDVAIQHVQNEPPQLALIRPDLPLELCVIVHKMMAKNADERYQNCKDLIRDLNRVRDSIVGGATLPQVVPFNSGVMSGVTDAVTVPNSASVFRDLSATGPSYPPDRRWGVRIVIGVILTLTLIGGFAVRALKERLSAKEPTKTQANGVPAETQPVISSEERFLLDASRQLPNPNTNDPRELKKALGYQVDLAIYYFRHNRIDDADKFLRALQGNTYKEMPSKAEHPYVYFARVGLALVQAFRDNARESAMQLGALLPKRGEFRSNPAAVVLFEDLEFSKIVAEALNRNAKNLKLTQFSDKQAHLEEYRHPPTIRLPRPPFGKAADLPKKG